jgi:transcriptional regulator with XRE-family HTH domain
MERDIRLNWEAITAEARRRREARGLTQMHLAALAKVSRSTLSRFENNSGDVQLSSVLRILSVLDMVDRKQEGTLLLRRHDNGTFSASFAPNLSAGGAMEAKVFPDLEALKVGLNELHVPEKVQSQVLRDLEQSGTARIFGTSLSTGELQRNWPVQFARAGEADSDSPHGD